jgi:hypothetical protein
MRNANHVLIATSVVPLLLQGTTRSAFSIQFLVNLTASPFQLQPDMNDRLCARLIPEIASNFDLPHWRSGSAARGASIKESINPDTLARFLKHYLIHVLSKRLLIYSQGSPDTSKVTVKRTLVP